MSTSDFPGTSRHFQEPDPRHPRPAMDDADLRDAIAKANIPTLVNVLFHLTGDRRWLEEPYRPTTTRGLDDHDDGGLAIPEQEEIRRASVEAITEWARGKPPTMPQPSPALLQEMMEACMGEPIPEVHARVMLVEMGFVDDETPSVPGDRPVHGDSTALIVGAGISGMAAAIRFRKAGIPFTIVEKNSHVGGTWWENRYPGAGVDTPSYLYSFSFFPRNWSTHFGKRDEVEAYLQDMAEHFDLNSSIRFDTEVTSAEWDEAGRIWRVAARERSGAEVELTCKFLVTAVGLLSRPKWPDLPGSADFRGEMFHSACWPADLEVTGKRVALLGTGASSMQIAPAIVDRVGELTIFQRSPQWAAPCEKYFRPVDEKVHWLMSNVPYYHRWYRFRLSWAFTDRVHPSLQIDPEWNHPERAVNAVNDAHRRYFTRYIESELGDREDLHEKVIPTYPPYGKRMLLDNGWFRTLTRSDVRLVTEAVASITETGLRTTDGEHHDADVIVVCTGFEAQKPLYPMDIRGRGGHSIRDAWGDDDGRAYLGMSTPDFPNLFFLYGPNTNPVGGSYIFIAECQARYISSLLTSAIGRGIDVLEVRREVHDEYNRAVDEAHSRMIWCHRGMETYYRNEKGRVVTNLPWRAADYWEMTQSAQLSDFNVSTVP